MNFEPHPLQKKFFETPTNHIFYKGRIGLKPVKNVPGHLLKKGYLATPEEIIVVKVDELTTAMKDKLNQVLWGDDKAISKKKWTRWLRFWNWRPRLKK